MAELKDLTADQKRRIFRDYLKGVPKDKIFAKHQIEQGVLDELIGLYGKKKHPNDVGNARDIEGPADLLVTPLDTGSPATEYPIIARNPRDLRLAQERPLQEYDWNGPEEKRRLQNKEITEELNKREADTRKAEAEEAKGIIASNKEATDATLEALTEKSTEGKKALASEAVETANSAKEVDQLRQEAREAAELAQRREAAGEALRQDAILKHREENAERDQKLIEAGKEQNKKELEAQEKARKEETESREKELRDVKQQESAEREGQAGERSGSGSDEDQRGTSLGAGLPSSDAVSAGSDQAARAPESAQGRTEVRRTGSEGSHQGAGREANRARAGEVGFAGETKSTETKPDQKVQLKPGETAQVRAQKPGEKK